jgi:predicted metal-dependent enzyme (double-stranded beta helix superfamily)
MAADFSGKTSSMPWLSEFALQCRARIDDGGTSAQVQTLVAKALEKQAAMPPQADIDRIVYRSDDLLIVSLSQPAWGNTPIHTHGIWCVIGVARGCEESAFFERRQFGLVEIERLSVHAGQSVVLAPEVIHKIRNPHGASSIGLHVYGGDLLSAKRQMWNPHTGEELPLEQSQFEAWCEELTAAASAQRELAPW